MKNEFDPYLTWFGIPRDRQPPDYYRLLGIDPFEDNLEVIEKAVARRVAYLQDVSSGPRVKHAQKMLNEVAAANVCLTDASKKKDYDRQLLNRREILAAISTRAAIAKSVSNRSKSGSHKKTLPEHARSNPQGGGGVFAKNGVNTGSAANIDENQPKKPAHASSKSNASIWIVIGVGALAVVILATVMVFKYADGGPDSRESGVNNVAQPDSGKKPGETGRKNTRKTTRTFDQYPLTPQYPDEPITLDAVTAEGLVLWLDADDPASFRYNRGNNVRWWLDRSGSQNHAGAKETGKQPKWEPDRLAGKPTVVFPGKRFLTVENESQFDFGTAFTLLFVAQKQKEKGVLLSKGIATETNCFSIYKKLTTLRLGKSNSQLYSATKEPEAFAVVALVVYDGSLQWFINGQADSKLHKITVANFDINNRHPLTIGNRSKSAFYFEGELAELLIYNRALSKLQRSSIENYLAEKWLR